MESSAEHHHHRLRRSTSSSALPTHENSSSTALLEIRKSVSQNGRSITYLKPNETDEIGAPPSSSDLGLLLLRAAQSLHASGDDPIKANRFALKAAEFFQQKLVEEGTTTVELLTSFQLLAATLCKLGQFEEAIQVLRKSVSFSCSSDLNLNPELANASFSVFMHLGDIYFTLGHYDSAMDSFRSGLDVQTQSLGLSHPQAAETCIYIAESYLQLMYFKEAEELCSLALNIHHENNSSSIEEVEARRLMGLIHNGRGENRAALEQLLLASSALSSLPESEQLEVAFLDVSIGETFVDLGRYDEALSSYHKALSVLKALYGEGHTAIASIFVSLADLHLKKGMIKDAQLHCEEALLIYGSIDANALNSVEEVAIGLTATAALFESMGELKHAISLLYKAREIIESTLEHPNAIVGGIEAQIGVMLQMTGNHREAYLMLRSAISSYRLVDQKKSLVVGKLLNQMGLACLGLDSIWEAAENFEQSKDVLERVCGAHHSNTLDVCINLAGTYDAMGRVDKAIDLLDGILEEMENRLGTANTEVEHIRKWLSKMLKETGRCRTRKAHTLQDLLLSQKMGHAVRLKATSECSCPGPE
ncbi:protein KINESIN LIGHT CHAIN-RELATED 2-like [Macadamia integrifolia]|uniref:protein KINESIN LIGHT CHAIN-RELATED 2-like n=1 Tax=Macadamia integrifolia TaxID=60698 RepID=UPI001C4EE4FA|nr:protein KINESIN LIGHT CHAIN-RELATED 2-like [Macadamia integrifolia]